MARSSSSHPSSLWQALIVKADAEGLESLASAKRRRRNESARRPSCTVRVTPPLAGHVQDRVHVLGWDIGQSPTGLASRNGENLDAVPGGYVKHLVHHR